MDAKDRALPGSQRLPNELHRFIAENLHYHRDRKTLLHLALASKSWRQESQRVLFRTVSDAFAGGYQYQRTPEKRRSLTHTHTLFLESIISSPARLALYVQTYQQCHLFSNRPVPHIDGAEGALHLWALTEEALPTLVNLRHLSILPIGYSLDVARKPPLKNCFFQLVSFRWWLSSESQDGNSMLVEFLRTQNTLEHLELDSYVLERVREWLPDDACPNLVSFACVTMRVEQLLTPRRSLTGLSTLDIPRIDEPKASALSRLRYLRVAKWNPRHSERPEHLDGVVLLELTTWEWQCLPGLPELRVLVLRRCGHPPNIAIDVLKSLREQDLSSHRDAGMPPPVNKCPKLEYILFERHDTDDKGMPEFRKISFTKHRGKRCKFYDEKFDYRPVPGMAWWTAYGFE